MATLFLTAACAGAGPYGFARTYVPLVSERSHLANAEELPYEQVKTAPYDYKDKEITWFGVVENLSDLPDGRTELTVAVRAHQARHLCQDEYEDSCRVTVSQTSSGKFITRLELKGKDKSGKERIWVGSLLKVYGHPSGDYDERGDPVIDTLYFRHWPRGTYVTTAQRSAMTR
ncbi:MAG: hypothetical protein JWN48_3735 [Myxococcaceae bacterium]|nr:hypothetical protein [Myxococcaceae bacterium]